MKIGELAAASLRDLVRREGEDISAEALMNAMRYVHKQIQLDADWRCQEARRTGLTYPANSTAGVVVESATGKDDCKKIREVYIVNGATLETVWPLTEMKASRYRRIAQIAQGSQPSVAGGWNQSWYEAGRRLVLLIQPTADLSLTVDYYRFLPFYEDAQGNLDKNLSDWFSDNMPHVMLSGAAYWLCKYFLEDPRAESFYGRYVDGLRMAYDADVRAKQGALSGISGPPPPQPAPVPQP